MKNILAIIPARGKSKGLPKKNIKLLAGKPLLVYSIEQSLKSKYITRVIVSTENEEIAEIAKQAGAEVPFLRPIELATDSSQTEPVLSHCIEYLKKKENYVSDLIVLLQPTSPIRTFEDIDNAIEKLIKTNADSLLSVCENHAFFWVETEENSLKSSYNFKQRPRRQDIKIKKYQENGSIYLTKTLCFEKNKNRLCGKIEKYIMSPLKSFEIDTLEDFIIVETVITKFFRDLI